MAILLKMITSLKKNSFFNWKTKMMDFKKPGIQVVICQFDYMIVVIIGQPQKVPAYIEICGTSHIYICVCVILIFYT